MGIYDARTYPNRTETNLKATEKLKSELKERLEHAASGPATKDIPLFELIPKYPVIDLPHEVTDAFPDYVKKLVLVRQQWAFALNRQNLPGDWDKAISILEDMITQRSLSCGKRESKHSCHSCPG
jgi:hypothetical protein